MSSVRPLLALAAAAAALSACSSLGGHKDATKAESKDGRISILTFEQKLEADPALKGQTPVVPTGVAVAEWTQPGGPATNAPPPAVMDGSLNLAWRKDVGPGETKRSRPTAPPVVADGRAFILNAGETLKALDVKTGQEIWSKSLTPKDGRDRQALDGGVAVADGRVYVTSGFRFAAAYDAATGAEIWRSPSASPYHAAPTVANGRLFAVNTDGELIALDANNGQQLWSYQAIAEPARILSASSPAVLDDAVIAPFASGQVVAFVPANGRKLWEDALTRAGRLTSLSAINDVAGRPVAVDGIVYAASHSGILAAIDERTGQRVWARGLASTQTPFVAGDALYIVTTDGDLTAIERASGRPYWVTELRRYQNEKKKKGRVSWTGPIMVNGKLFLASSLGQGVFVDPLKGAVERTLDIGAPVYIPPVTAAGEVLLMTEKGDLVALR